VLVRLHEAVRLSAAVERKGFGDDWLKREATVTALRSRLARVIVARFWSAGKLFIPLATNPRFPVSPFLHACLSPWQRIQTPPGRSFGRECIAPPCRA
jgi:hypothetical protein